MYLKNIEKIFKIIPTTFIFLSCIVAIIINYVILQSKEQREIDLLKQKKILENQFEKKEQLHSFNLKVKDDIDIKLAEIKKVLQEHTFKVIGSLSQQQFKKDSKDSINFLRKYERNNLVYIVLFEESNLNIIHGKDKIEFLSKLIFGTLEEKHKKIVLQYIVSQGKSNLQEWRNDLRGTLRLSFFDKLEFQGKNYYVGTFSKLVNIRAITKKLMQKEIDSKTNTKDYYVWFYDFKTNDTYNFNNDKQNINLNKVLHKFNEKFRREFIEQPRSSRRIKEFMNHFILHDNKCKFSIGINSSKKLDFDSSEITTKYKYFFIKYSVWIIIVSFLLVVLFRHFSLFIKVQLDAQELKKRVEEELEKNRQKDRILIQQSKLAAMGEMLGNIAHQWRQPLNNVSLFLQFIKTNYDKKNVDKDLVVKYFHKAFTQIDYMSQTIDDFRNFYKPSKQKSSFQIKDALASAVDIIAVQLKNENIEIIKDIEDIILYSFESELKQALLNILSNAHQAIKERKLVSTFRPYIKIKVKKIDNKLEIVISNNGGSIKDEILSRIFEPYFTTKFESQGTGVGLYMTKSIIEVNLKGTIEAQNFTNGVSFKIMLPLDKGIK